MDKKCTNKKRRFKIDCSKLPVATETQEAYKFATWAYLDQRTKGALLHFANEGKRSAAYGHKLKRMGMRPGTADYFLAIPVEKYPGLFLELKRSDKSKSSLTDLQKQFLADMASRGYYCTVAYGADQAIAVVNDYLAGKI